MEILIVGIAVVALMVYVSTKIKKSAEQAYNREFVETAEFSLVKPEGYLHPLRDKSEFAFEAYSQNYGEGNLKNVWQSNAEMVVHSNKNFKEVCAEAKKNADEILSENVLKETPEDQRICLLEGEKIIDEVKKHVFWKIVESVSQEKVYELRIFVLEENLPEFDQKVKEMLESFTLN